MDISQAREIADRLLAKFGEPANPVALFGNEAVKDAGWCFVFPWDTARYVETRDRRYLLGPGCGPIAVVKESGDAWMMHGATSSDVQLAAYAVEHGIAI